MTRRLLPLFALSALCAIPTIASAAITGTTGAATVYSTIPSSVASNTWESDTQIRAFAEQQNLTLGAPLAVDISTPGISPSATTSNLSPATIPAGTPANSYMLHFDPVGSKDPSNATEAIGTITFDQPVLGLIALSDTLNTSNALVGLSTVIYSSGPDHGLDFTPGGVGTGLNDEVILSADDRTVTLDSRASYYADDLRIITAAPEPSSLALLALGAWNVWSSALGRNRRRSRSSLTQQHRE